MGLEVPLAVPQLRHFSPEKTSVDLWIFPQAAENFFAARACLSPTNSGWPAAPSNLIDRRSLIYALQQGVLLGNLGSNLCSVWRESGPPTLIYRFVVVHRTLCGVARLHEWEGGGPAADTSDVIGIAGYAAGKLIEADGILRPLHLDLIGVHFDLIGSNAQLTVPDA